LALLLAACGAPEGPPEAGGAGDAATVPAEAASQADGGEAAAGEPVTLNIIDVAGNLQLTQPMIDAYVEANPDKVASVNYDEAPSPDLAGRIQAEQQGNKIQTDLVLTGNDGLAAGIEFGLWEEIVPAYEETGAD